MVTVLSTESLSRRYILKGKGQNGLNNDVPLNYTHINCSVVRDGLISLLGVF